MGINIGNGNKIVNSNIAEKMRLFQVLCKHKKLI